MEKDILASEIGGKIEVIPTGTVIPDEVRPRKGRNNILFVGSMNRTQNIDAVSYFCGKVFPDVKAVLNEVTLTIAGSGADSGNLSFIPESAAVTGFVRDIGVYYSSYAVSVVPLRVGAGMKSKIIESMAWGCPVVSTVVGAEGMGFTPGNDILIADDPKEFAEKIVNIYTDQDLWNKISLNAYQKVKEYYDIGRMSDLILDLI